MISEKAVVQTRRIGRDVTIGEFAVVRPGVELADGVEIAPFALVGMEPRGGGVLKRRPVFEKRILIGRGTFIGPHAVVYYDVEIGEETLIADGVSIREQCGIGSRCVLARYVTVNYHTVIGDRTKIMDSTHITGNCRIGSDVFISLLVGTVNDNSLGKRYSDQETRGPIIEDQAFIGVGAVLLPGVRIGRGAVVGAGSIVTKDVEPWTLVMGAPARFVRRVRPEEV